MKSRLAWDVQVVFWPATGSRVCSLTLSVFRKHFRVVIFQWERLLPGGQYTIVSMTACTARSCTHPHSAWVTWPWRQHWHPLAFWTMKSFRNALSNLAHASAAELK